MTENQKTTPVACPNCNETKNVELVEIKRIERRYPNAKIEEYEETPGVSSKYLIVSPASEEEVVDSMSNEEFFSCRGCGHNWDVPEIDDIFVTED